jgi:ribosomal protein L1
MKSNNLAKELETALRKCTMSMTNNGTTSSIRVGLSNFEEEQLVENIMAVYEILSKKFPGKFANIRSINLRFGREEWSVPVYISYGQQYLFIIYILKN